MTTPHARTPRIMDRPACTPAAIRAVLAANAGAAVLERYDHELDAAFEQARQDGDLTPLVQRQTHGATLTPSANTWHSWPGTCARDRRLLRSA